MLSQQRETLIRERGLDRTRPVESPEVARPTGRFPTLAEAIQHFIVARNRTIGFVENSSEDLRRKITTHPLIGTVNCYETLLMIAAHPHLHAEQIQEIKIALG
jgi:hypothetical protein